jgi:RNA polymerase sigma-70 factor (ECF subfamily)
MNSSLDTDLLRRAQHHDLSALTAIYDRYNQALYYYALRLLGDTSLAEDCVSETFSRLLKAFRAGQGPDENLKAYLYRTAHNWVTDQYRHQSIPHLELKDDLAENDLTTPVEQAESHIQQEKVRAALRLLTTEQRQVVALRFVEGWELDEIAASLQKPIGAVKALQHRAIDSLRKLLLEKDQADV